MKPPFDGPLDLVSEQPDDRPMDARVTKLEADVTTIKIDVAVTKANGATKSDLSELKTEMRTGFAEIRAEMNAGFADVRAEMRAEFAAVRAEMRGHGKDVETLIAKGHTRIIMWVGSFIFLAQLLPILKEMDDDRPAPPPVASQSAPIAAPLPAQALHPGGENIAKLIAGTAHPH